ncbi:MAG: hypothetical protein IPM88_18290 [Nitrospira sp.]|nr:hypothetical protein [Nitrospira sp.]
MEADIQVAEREVKALNDDEKADLSAIEAKLKQSADVQIGLRVLSIKTRREALALLTPEQRAKEQAEHEKMMQQHTGAGQAAPHGKNPHRSNPHGANPHGEAKPSNRARCQEPEVTHDQARCSTCPDGRGTLFHEHSPGVTRDKGKDEKWTPPNW